MRECVQVAESEQSLVQRLVERKSEPLVRPCLTDTSYQTQTIVEARPCSKYEQACVAAALSCQGSGWQCCLAMVLVTIFLMALV